MPVEVKQVEQHHFKKPFSFHGRLGGAFNVEGQDFGSSGTMLIGGRNIETTTWGDTLLKGQLPMDIVAGPISINGKVVGTAFMRPDVNGQPSLVMTTVVPAPPASPGAVIGPSGITAAPVPDATAKK